MPKLFQLSSTFRSVVKYFGLGVFLNQFVVAGLEAPFSFRLLNCMYLVSFMTVTFKKTKLSVIGITIMQAKSSNVEWKKNNM